MREHINYLIMVGAQYACERASASWLLFAARCRG